MCTGRQLCTTICCGRKETCVNYCNHPDRLQASYIQWSTWISRVVQAKRSRTRALKETCTFCLPTSVSGDSVKRVLGCRFHTLVDEEDGEAEDGEDDKLGNERGAALMLRVRCWRRCGLRDEVGRVQTSSQSAASELWVASWARVVSRFTKLPKKTLQVLHMAVVTS